MNTPNTRPRGRNTGTSGQRRRTGGPSTRLKKSNFKHSKGPRTSSHRKGGNFGGHGRSKRKIPTFDPSQFINKNPVEVVEEIYVPQHKFNDFKIDSRIKDVLAKMNIIMPSPIQDQTIAHSLEGRDVVGLAETGTGKTAAFLIPLIQRTLSDKDHQTLILAPTRELAIQIDDELQKLARHLRMVSVVCVGGMNIRPQRSALQRRHSFIIGTPGRVLDLIERKSIRPNLLKAVVLDEADRMLDMGFIHDMRSILSATPKDRHTLFFSATMSPATKKLVHEFLNDPVIVSVKKKDTTDSIEQDVVPYDEATKFETLVEMLRNVEYKRVIVFGAMKHSVKKLALQLSDEGIRAESIHGNKTHVQRQRALKAFKNGRVRVLTATDVAARGIHVDDVSHVINYDLPQTFDDYIHRIGRTGRGTKRGKALTFVTARKTPRRR